MSSTGEIVQAVGNSWIICRSKSYAGRIYYFNTLTGEAAWNLSESEIEKAKKRTSMLENQTGVPVDNCPEPMESPQDYPSEIPSHSNHHIPTHSVPLKVFNNQIINNQFPKLPYQIAAQFSNISSLNPIQFNIPITPSVNSGIWNVPSHPMFITPNTISQQSMLSNNLNNYDYVPVTNTAVSLTNRFTSLDEISKKLKPFQRKSQLHTRNISGVRKNHFRNRFHNWSNKKDLRLLLSSKKRKPESSNTLSEEKRNNYHLISCDDDDEMWLEANLRTQSSNESLDISALKKLLRIEDNFKVWYIVTDSNVMLNSINFLNILLNSDNQCRLMVPQIVMDKIQKATNSRFRTHAHRAAYFISQQIDANIAAIDEPNVQYNDDRGAIMNCCAKLVDQGYEVVLLTDDVDLHNLENTRFVVLTVKEIKKILIKTEAHGSVNNDSKEVTNQKRNIKITISNDLNEVRSDHIQQNRHETVPVIVSEATIDKNSLIDDASIQLQVEDVVRSNNIQKKTDNVAVQADSSELDAIHKNNDQRADTFPSSNTDLKSKKIHLKRSLSHDINLSNNTGTKTFKWSKRRPKTSLSSNFCHSKLSESDLTNIGTAAEESFRPNCQKSCGYVSLESIESCRRYSNGESSESSSVVVPKKCREGSIVDETSASETPHIPRTVDMENNQSLSETVSKGVKEPRVSKSCVNKDENVMFEVTSKAMEDILKMKCDEWVSRFVQIIEEASTQVLQQDPPFILDTMLPPWTIYEATECIKRKFSNDNDTVDAANKLLNVLFEIGGLRGKIKIDINPNKYMEMYSYGVYLIDALQGLLSNSEDLQIAAESLSKLLIDIQDSHLNPGNQDSFTDDHIHNQDKAIANILPENSIKESKEKVCNDTEIASKEISDEVDSVKYNGGENNKIVSNSSPAKSNTLVSSPGKYHLRSHRKKLLQKNDLVENVSFIRNIDLESSFFMSLRLKKANKDVGTKVTNSNNEDIADKADGEIANAENSLEYVKETNDKIDTAPEKDIFTNEPKVIRNFIRCPEFEEKIKNKSNLVFDSWTNKNENQSEMDYSESEQYDYELMADEYYCGNDYDYEYEYESFDGEEVSGDNIDKNAEGNLNTAMEIQNINFKAIIQKIQENIKETFSSVHGFCEKCYSTLSSDEGNFEKNDIQNLAEKTHSYLNDLCDALTSVLTRETSSSAYKMQELLKVEEFKDIVVEDGDLEGYRNFITQCLEQGSILKESVKLIIEATRE
ncbi:uncharacterized protein LOC124535105 isoform X2 [Vanessa cardui]|uniref:uncharacterized protein LOC124535105 isoform X2 n=1 Tax=Vanessa cardui TaxID=171605 RepID=UPI001F12DF96|nr:uncharacterized protein LOC124535105 isoform X2 [Vanessa cardui]